MNILRNHSFRVLCLLLTPLFWAVSSQASVIGVIYQNDPNATDASLLPPAGLPSATFTTNNIDFNTHIEGGWVSAFLGSIDVNGPAGHDYQTFTNQQNGFNPNASISDSFISFTGATYLNAGSNVLNLTHQGGAILTFTGIGTVVNQPTTTNQPGNPFIINAPASGYYNFALNYVTGLDPVSQLTFQVNYQPVGTPEPASIALLGAGLLATALLARRRQN